jgi:hypothetical protein
MFGDTIDRASRIDLCHRAQTFARRWPLLYHSTSPFLVYVHILSHLKESFLPPPPIILGPHRKCCRCTCPFLFRPRYNVSYLAIPVVAYLTLGGFFKESFCCHSMAWPNSWRHCIFGKSRVRISLEIGYPEISFSFLCFLQANAEISTPNNVITASVLILSSTLFISCPTIELCTV